ncbi:mitochondrial amidoxime reducing component 2 [Pelobates cultripes]|uniref:Mitochondrial amidoxime reducing component 2 n=1 Tax=Pelobates cultripes TaxID=61616 RepID=A0AAD1VWJ0_PELCU|nr:mitochondrial amidoxime reducing component 2 [Pelobates cultripes]
MESLSPTRATLFLAVTGLGAAVLVSWFFLTKRRRSLRKVGEVSHLFLYPIKSCRGTSIPEAECKPFGLQSGNLKDRHWLVVKENKVHVTARQEPQMVLITASCDKDKLTLRAPEMEHLQIPLKLPSSNGIFTCKVHGNEVCGRDCGDKASQWITSFLKSKEVYRLVQFEDNMKPRNPKNEYEKYTDHDKVAYPDLSPLLLMSEASVDNLNTKLQKMVTIRNFRPNIVVTGCEAHEEDSWEEVQIGTSVTLKRVMPCPRCILTTVNPDTGVIDMKEPLETMRSYRLHNPLDQGIFKTSPLFGQYVRIQQTGIIKVGDPVYQITY